MVLHQSNKSYDRRPRHPRYLHFRRMRDCAARKGEMWFRFCMGGEGLIVMVGQLARE